MQKPSFLALPMVSIAFLTASLTTAGAAGRHQEAHVHGHGTVNIVIDGSTVAVELEAPGADIVGFEHAPESAEDKSKIAAAEETLGRAANIITLPRAAACLVKKSHIDHEQSKGDDGVHSAFHVAYEFECGKPSALTSIAFPYFKEFPNAEELDVTIVSGSGQSSHEAEPDEPEVTIPQN